MDKRNRRLRRSRKARSLQIRLGMYRLRVHRTPRHMYAQVVTPQGDRVLASASTVEKASREELGYTGNVQAASLVGRRIAERALAAGIDKVAFDRAGFRYHGRVKALAEAAREGGLEI